MKSILFLLGLFLVLVPKSKAQKPTATLTVAEYKDFPAYRLLSPDSVQLSSLAVLKKNKPTLMMYFSPTCSHCQHQAELLTGHIKEISGLQVLMVSNSSLKDIRTFINSYGLVNFKNIVVAQDPQFAMGAFYALHSLPGLFFYDKNARLVTDFDQAVTIEALQQAMTTR